MKMLSTLTAIVVMIVGFGLAGSGPVAFEFLTGHEVPRPDANDPFATTVWSGIALLRVFGAALLGLGAVLLATTMRHYAFTVERASFVSFLFAAILTAGQAQAIWDGRWGFVLAALLAAASLVAGAQAFGNRAREPGTRAA